ncbi:hypothetical protein KEM56_006293 [Ascosphaera pollenicola]|nr:hypothetical protein KEM56_006293 [Ascosphaera pollenicola]
MSSGRSCSPTKSEKSHRFASSSTNTLTKSCGKLSVMEANQLETNQRGEVIVSTKRINRILRTRREPAFPKRTVVRPGRSANFWFDGPEGQISSDEEDLDHGSVPQNPKPDQDYNLRMSSAIHTRRGSIASYDSSTPSLSKPSYQTLPMNGSMLSQYPHDTDGSIHHDSMVDSGTVEEQMPVSDELGTQSDAASSYSRSSSQCRSGKDKFSNLNQESILHLSSSEDDADNELDSSGSYMYHTTRGTLRNKHSSKSLTKPSAEQKKMHRRSSTGSHMAAAVRRPSFIPVMTRRSSASGPLNSHRINQNASGPLNSHRINHNASGPFNLHQINENASGALDSHRINQNDSRLTPSSDRSHTFGPGQNAYTTRLRALQEEEERSHKVHPVNSTTLDYGEDVSTAKSSDNCSGRRGFRGQKSNRMFDRPPKIPYEVLLELIRNSQDVVPEKYLREIIKKSRDSADFDELFAAAQLNRSDLSFDFEEKPAHKTSQKSLRRPSMSTDRERRRSKSLQQPQMFQTNHRDERTIPLKASQRLGPPLFTDRSQAQVGGPARRRSFSSQPQQLTTDQSDPSMPSTANQRLQLAQSPFIGGGPQAQDTPSQRRARPSAIDCRHEEHAKSYPSKLVKPSSHHHHHLISGHFGRSKDHRTQDAGAIDEKKLREEKRPRRSPSFPGSNITKPILLKSPNGATNNQKRSKSTEHGIASPSQGHGSNSRASSHRNASPNSNLSPSSALTTVSQKPPRTPRLRARYKFSPRLLEPPSLSPNTEEDNLEPPSSGVSTVRDMLLKQPMDKTSAPSSVEPSMISDYTRSESSGTPESVGVNDAAELTIVTAVDPQSDYGTDEGQTCTAVWSIHEKRSAKNVEVHH